MGGGRRTRGREHKLLLCCSNRVEMGVALFERGGYFLGSALRVGVYQPTSCLPPTHRSPSRP